VEFQTSGECLNAVAELQLLAHAINYGALLLAHTDSNSALESPFWKLPITACTSMVTASILF